MYPRTFVRGEVVIREGDYTRRGYRLKRGWAEVYLEGPPERVLARLGPGDIFGEMALISGRPRSASVRALDDIEVEVFEPSEVPMLIEHDARGLLMTLIDRVHSTNEQLKTRRGRKSRDRRGRQSRAGSTGANLP
jgi:CRP/FNR family cyclic AMP-dependent transcriptional regulator